MEAVGAVQLLVVVLVLVLLMLQGEDDAGGGEKTLVVVIGCFGCLGIILGVCGELGELCELGAGEKEQSECVFVGEGGGTSATVSDSPAATLQLTDTHPK